MTWVPDGNDVSYDGDGDDGDGDDDDDDDGDDENHPHLDFSLKEPIDQV